MYINNHRSECILVLHHHCHAHRDHINVDLLVPDHIHLQVIVRFGLAKLCLVDVVQLLQEDQLQLFDLFGHLVDQLEPLLRLAFFLALLETHDGLLEVVQKIGVDFLDRFVLDVVDEGLYGVEDLLSYYQFVCDFVLYHHQLLPVFQRITVYVGISFIINRFQELREDLDEFVGHQEIPHGLDDVMVPADGQHHVVDPLLEDGVDDAHAEQEEDVEIPHQLQQRVLRKQVADGDDDRQLPDLSVVQHNRRNVEHKSNPQHHQQLILHRVRLMDKRLQPEAVDDDTQPHKLMNSLLDAEPQFLAIAGIVEGVGVDIDIGHKIVLIRVIGNENGNDLGHDHCEQKQHQIILILEEFKDPRLAARGIDLMRIHQPEAPEQVDEVDAAVEGVEHGAVGVLEVSPVSGEVVVGVGERVDDEVDGDYDYGEDAQHWRSLLHRVVVLEDEPLRTDPHGERDYQQDEAHLEVHLRLDLARHTVVVLAPAEKGRAVFAH